MKTERLKSQTLEEVAKDWGIDYQVFKIKSELIDTIKKYCTGHHVSQRKLAAMVPGLTQDRISKIFSGQVGHMTIDKLIEILSALALKNATYNTNQRPTAHQITEHPSRKSNHGLCNHFFQRADPAPASPDVGASNPHSHVTPLFRTSHFMRPLGQGVLPNWTLDGRIKCYWVLGIDSTGQRANTAPTIAFRTGVHIFHRMEFSGICKRCHLS